MPLQAARRLFTVDEYYQMAAAGILHEDDRVELIEGEIVQMAAIGSRHAGCVDRLTQFFVLHVAGQAIVRIQNPIRLNNRSEPQPDMSLLTPRPDFYMASHPGPQDVLLVVEVADTSRWRLALLDPYGYRRRPAAIPARSWTSVKKLYR